MSKKIYVGNLSWNTTDETLKAAFSEFGQVVDWIVMRDRNTGRSRGFGFVTFNTDEEVQAAINGLNNEELDGRRLNVNLANALERDRYRERERELEERQRVQRQRVQCQPVQRQRERLVRQAQLLQQLEAPPGACTGGLPLNHLSSLSFLLVLAALAHELVGWFLFLGLLVTILAYLLLIIPHASPSTVWPCRVHGGSSASRRGFSVAHYPAYVSGNCRPILHAGCFGLRRDVGSSTWRTIRCRPHRVYATHRHARSQGYKMCSPGSLCTGFTRKIQAPNGS